jgi:hypothetical protein
VPATPVVQEARMIGSETEMRRLRALLWTLFTLQTLARRRFSDG